MRCNGVYSYRLTNPLLFYTNVCGNVERDYSREEIDSQLKAEFISALQPAFAKLALLEMRPNQIPAHAEELSAFMNETLTRKWGEMRGISIVSIGMNSITIPDEDAESIKQLQRSAVMRDPTMAAANLVGAQADAMRAAAENSAGAMTGFMGMGMAMNAGGVNAQNLYAMAQPQAQTAAPAAESWRCACGSVNTGKFCPECGAKKPVYRCNKCGWKPADPSNPPKFCPECGDPFDEGDLE